MFKFPAAAIAAVLLAAGLTVSPASAATSDSHTSTDNSKLSCKLDVSVSGGKVTVSWTITGATKASIDPLTFKGGVPLKGTQTIDASGGLTIMLVAQDAQGHTVRCSADNGVMPTPSPPPVVGGSAGQQPA